MYKKNIFCFLLLIGMLAPAALLNGQVRTEAFNKGLETITEQSLKAQLEFLASDWFAGRETATPGAYMAADYIASQFKQTGLQPYFPNEANGFSGYHQNVKLIASHVESSSMTLIRQNEQSQTREVFNHQTDYLPATFLKDIQVEGSLFFGKYGLHQPGFENLKGAANGQILVRIAGFPHQEDTTAQGSQTFGKMTKGQLYALKNRAAKEAGFTAILEYNPENPSPVSMPHPGANQTPSEKTLHKRSSGMYNKQVRLINQSTEGIPVFEISQDIIMAIFPDWETQLVAEKNSSNQSAKNLRASLEIHTHRELIECRNVLAVIEGENPDEVIVVGAHYDHLGEYNGYIWNGADDNASGTVGIMALAKAFMASGIKPKKTLVFAAWTAEERGLHGSTFFVESHPNPSTIRYHLNYDMIGREADPAKPDMQTSFIYSKSWEEAANLIRNANNQLNLNLSIRFAPSDNLKGGSDQAPFAQKGIPVMWFYTGGHSDYHGPYDHADKINYHKMSAIIKASYSALWKLANE